MSSHTHPRRRPQKPVTSPMTPPPLPSIHTLWDDAAKTMSLRKSETFHSPTSSYADQLDIRDIATHPPRRSVTSLNSLLEDLVGEGKRRAQRLLEPIERELAGLVSSACAPNNNTILDREALPLPGFIVNSLTSSEPMDIDQPEPSKKVRPTRARHDSDSGLGSSITETMHIDHSHLAKKGNDLPAYAGSFNGGVTDTYKVQRVSTSGSLSGSALTKSHSALSSTNNTPARLLSEHAIRQIKDLIVTPILREESLKDFHPLVKEVPARIGNKLIANLRDLEKTLIFLAPRYSATSKLYLAFCETSVRCLQTTVHHVSESDQRLPTDRPYTDNYFLDLVEQIRKYAAIMAATREKEAKGEELTEMDYSRDEKIILRGGLSHDGKPAELVREKNGKIIPIGASAPYGAKRALAEEDEDEDDAVRRSMARRRKSEKPGDVIHMCRDCRKEFKRPCDLTKHEKTHSRPWKCPEVGCKYHEHGWPTEKEMERHINDKHSSSPTMYKCQYNGCTYSSKRESNCKQHMEKAHGWTYVRSKSNGRPRGSNAGLNSAAQTPITPLLDTPASGFQAINTPMTPFAPSPSEQSHYSRGQSASVQNAMTGPTFNMNFISPSRSSAPNFNMFTPGEAPLHSPNALYFSPPMNDNRRGSATTNQTYNTYSTNQSPLELMATSFEDQFTPNDDLISNDYVFDGNTLRFGTYQPPTPAQSAQQHPVHDFEMDHLNVNTSIGNVGMPQLSPNGQADIMLFPEGGMDVDETFGEGNYQDFALFDGPNANQTTSNDIIGTLFPDLAGSGAVPDNNSHLGSQFDFSSNNPLVDFYANNGFATGYDDVMFGHNGQN